MSLIRYPTEEQLKKLASKGEELLKRVELDPDWQPVVIEFAGTPKSGKSTNIEILNHFFRRIGFKVDAPTEGVSKRTPYHLKRDFMAYNSWALCYAISSLLIGYYNIDRHHIIMLDRGPFDSLAWMRHLMEKGKLSKGDYDIICNFVTLDKWGKLVDRIYLFTCNPEISLKREAESKLILRPGVAMNEDMLSLLKKQYDALKEEVPLESPYLIDTSDTETPIGTSYELACDILNIIESHLNR